MLNLWWDLALQWHQVIIFNNSNVPFSQCKLQLILKCSLGATWLWRKCGFFPTAACNQVQLLDSTFQFWACANMSQFKRNWGRAGTLWHCIQNSMEAMLACHSALPTKWLDWVHGWQKGVSYGVCAQASLWSSSFISWKELADKPKWRPLIPPAQFSGFLFAF